MRALGPGSVSSLLKVALDVVHFALWTAACVSSAVLLTALLFSIRSNSLDVGLAALLRVSAASLAPLLAAALAALDLYFVGAILIVGRLRQISQTMVAGDPFHPENVRRLQLIAAALAGLELGRYVVTPILRALAHDSPRLRLTGGISLTTWFGVLVIIVLAEVFREGARLRREAELTI